MVIRVRKRGQITLPAEARKQLGWKPGDVLEFELKSDRSIFVRRIGTTRFVPTS